MRIITTPLLEPDQEPVLAGRLDGRRTLARLLAKLPTISLPTIVALDFRGVDLATSSYLSEAVLAFRDHLRLRRVPAYPIAVNLNERVREELDDLLCRTGDALFVCDTEVDGAFRNSALLGTLDAKLKDTFELVRHRGEATATQLHAEDAGADRIGPTGWNNRLNALAAKGLLIEIPLGRAKKYRLVLEATDGA